MRRKCSRVGIGYDIHRLAEGRELWLGGVQVPYHMGLVGHSDADVLLHAICDALLGAAALGDIGYHFPDTDPQYKGINSQRLLQEVAKLVRSEGYVVGNVDSVIVTEQPKLQAFIPEMRSVIANILEIPESDVSVKASTNERLGDIGKGEGIMALTNVMIHPQDDLCPDSAL
ncbi:MAG: 2-C-methyl-D-erythritol 2,4-cyclodiphosphate synthase [Porphyromonas sp.]|nr:2-C-methyl-D-erythritol 2,4-cyclodiphosphate synthase [Porphyromonas sp.]